MGSYDYGQGLQPDLDQARRKAHVAHGVVIKLKEMGLPPVLDSDLASLSTDLGDLWSAQKELADRVEGLLKEPQNWEEVGDHLVDIRSSLDHIAWHLNSVRQPLNRTTRFAYRKVLDDDANG